MEPQPADSSGDIYAVEDPRSMDYGPWMLVMRRRGRGGGRGFTGGSGGLGSCVVHAKPCDPGSSLANVSNVRNHSAWVTRGSSSMRGRGGSVTTRAQGTRNIEDETTSSFEKVPFHVPQDDLPVFADLLWAGMERGTSSNARLLMAPKGALTLVPFPSPKESAPIDTPTRLIFIVSSKEKQINYSASQDLPGNGPVLRVSKHLSEE